jgi:excisionase family DNA binding protein
MPDSPPPLLHTVKAVAARLAVSESMIWRLLRAGELRPTRIMGRVLISEAELQRLIEKHTDRGTPSREANQDTSEAKPLMVLHSHKYP